MSELKPYRFVRATENSNTGGVVYTSRYVYAQDDVDKILAEKDQELESYKNVGAKLSLEIAELKAERRWRKCSDEMPEDGTEVLATDGNGVWLCYKTTLYNGSPWFQPDGQPHIEGVTHWMPLPSAPKEEK